MAKNAQWIYARKPKGEVRAAHFEAVERAMPEPGQGEALVRTTLLSLDPASRAWMAGRTYRASSNPAKSWPVGDSAKSSNPIPKSSHREIS